MKLAASTFALLVALLLSGCQDTESKPSKPQGHAAGLLSDEGLQAVLEEGQGE